jgi:hypothetical protein
MFSGERVDPVDDEEASKLTRRDALQRAAKLGGALVWAVPLVQTVDIRAAAALAGSPAPEDPSTAPDGGTNPDGGIDPVGGTDPGGGGGSTPTPAALEILDLSAMPLSFVRGRGGRLRIRFRVTAAAVTSASILRGSRTVRNLPTHELSGAGWVSDQWNGRGRRKKRARSGQYVVVAHAVDANGAVAEARTTFSIAY